MQLFMLYYFNNLDIIKMKISVNLILTDNYISKYIFQSI